MDLAIRQAFLIKEAMLMKCGTAIFQIRIRGLDAQAAALRRDMVARAQELFRLGGRPALQQSARRELRRADAGQTAPGGRLAQAHGRLIIGILQQTAAI